MGNLNCNAASCMHNCDNQCCLNSICVEGSSACQCGETCCSDYEHQKPGATNMCHLPKDSLSISCEATNCIYNTNKKCDADHVDISGIKAVTGRYSLYNIPGKGISPTRASSAYARLKSGIVAVLLEYPPNL